MSAEEAIANVRHFTKASTRSLPVETLVISGVGAASRPDLGDLVGVAHTAGIRTTILHVGVEDLDTLAPDRLPPVSRLVIPLSSGDAAASLSSGAEKIAAALGCGLGVSANVALTHSSLKVFPAILRILLATRVGVTFTFPFPVDGGQATEVPTAGQAILSLQTAVPALLRAGVRVDIKGLPPCYLGDMAGLVRKTANRWYVDADHQLEGALLFFPDVVAFFKGEDCRFCRLDGGCDGFFATYLRRPGFPALAPVAERAG